MKYFLFIIATVLAWPLLIGFYLAGTIEDIDFVSTVAYVTAVILGIFGELMWIPVLLSMLVSLNY